VTGWADDQGQVLKEFLEETEIAGFVVVTTRRAYHSASKNKVCSSFILVCCLMLLLFKGKRV